jgi:hypothetical protein
VEGEIAALICAASPGEKACRSPGVRSWRAAIRSPCQFADPLVGGVETGLERIIVGTLFQAGIHGRQRLVAPALQPVDLDADLARDRIE